MKILSQSRGTKKSGFTFTEVMITLSLFMVLASVGMGAYFRYYNFSLITNDISRVSKILHDTRFKAMKNPSGSDYGLHIATGTNELTTFRDTYTPEHPENQSVRLDQLNISEVSLAPTPGLTNSVLFEHMTGKTQNSGFFIVENDDFSYTFNINPQGVFE